MLRLVFFMSFKIVAVQARIINSNLYLFFFLNLMMLILLGCTNIFILNLKKWPNSQVIEVL